MDKRLREIRLNNSRWMHRLRRKGKRRSTLEMKFSRKAHIRITYKSKILDLFDYDKVGKKKNISSKEIIFPPEFSVSKNPKHTLNTICEIVKYARTAWVPRLVLDHRPVKKMGLGADALLGVILKEIKRENQWVKGSYIRGYKPKSKKIRKIMDEIGCVSVLNSGHDDDVMLSLKSSVEVFRHINRGKNIEVDPLTLDPTSKTVRDFSNHLDSCLKIIHRRLTKKGRNRLLQHVSEVLTNAQEHSGTSEWTIAGFIDHEDEQLIYRCVIFSLGYSIADTFDNAKPDSQSWRLVAPYIERHEISKLFGKSWHRDDLLTIIALQGHVSSKLDEDPSRGQGTVDLIQFFQEVSKECVNSNLKPELNIVSGSTLVIFDGRYEMEYIKSLDRMVIAFNPENNLLSKPDGDCVRALDGCSFPGVMISITMPLASDTFEVISSQGADNEN